MMDVHRTLQLGAKDENMSLIHVAAYGVLFLGALVLLITPAFIPNVPLDVTSSSSSDVVITGEYFTGGYASGSYWVWMAMSLGCPALVLLSYVLPGKIAESRYVSIWLRLAGDSGQLFALVAFEVSTFKLISAAGLYRTVIFGAFVAFVVIMVLRDIALIIATERLARTMREEERSAGGEG
jgi:hypothetical protein